MICVWRTKQLNIVGKNLTNVQYATIGDKVKFIDTMKYYPQSLASAALSTNKLEKSIIRESCQKIFEKKFKSFESLTNENKE